MESEFDDLKAAVDCYVPDPRAGIEQRVLYRVRAFGRRRRFYWIWAIPALLLLVLMFWPRPVETPKPALVTAAPPRPLPEVGQALSPARKPRHLEKVQPFPTPTPLTDEERALQALAVLRPQDAQQLLAHADDKPIEIQELQIPPLQSDGGQWGQQ